MAQAANNPHLPARISLRPASAADSDFLYQVYCSTRQDEMAPWGWSEAQKSAFLRMQYEIRQRGYAAAYPAAEYSVILVEGSCGGSMILSRGPGEIRLVDIALLPEFRNRGVGQYLIKMLLSEASGSRMALRLSILRGNRAAHLYERLGLTAVGGDSMYCEMECVPAESQAGASVSNSSWESISNARKSE